MAQQDRFKNRSNNNKVNINYLSKDFVSLKDSLMNLAKSYFPNSYNDFNETSPGMMLMEMNAYVGDVLSYYIDHQYKEMLLPLSEERRNVINIANMLGYKVKSTVPAIVELRFRQTVPHDGSGDDPRLPDYTKLMSFNKGLRVKSATNSDVFFETLDVLDFSVTGSNDAELVPIGQDSTGLTNSWECVRKVLAISGKTKSITFNISNPKPYLELTIPETNVVNIVSPLASNHVGGDMVDNFLLISSPPTSLSSSISSLSVSIISNTGATRGDFLITVKCFSCTKISLLFSSIALTNA